eukprot:TRINITY_DN9343_c0_g3_i1.p1 TRINITY_DN9343_c0_g3~~TRINITY_DN9343_c0_g3_i1.p1  ORF type:complete len:185 (-),score=49.68 TRINITY_DN9343_c0_g3_i1:101-655(-)
MGKKPVAKKKAAGPAEEKEAALAAPEPWTCAECDQENEAEATECAACEVPRPATEADGGAEEDRYKGYLVGLVASAEKVAGKDKLLQLQVDVGAAEPLAIVTNAPNVKEGSRVVVATVGSTVSDKGEDIVVQKQAVGGCMSHGMICDGPMLGWTGGGAGAAALLPDTFGPGDRPPATRPRMDGK